MTCLIGEIYAMVHKFSSALELHLKMLVKLFPLVTTFAFSQSGDEEGVPKCPAGGYRNCLLSVIYNPNQGNLIPDGYNETGDWLSTTDSANCQQFCEITHSCKAFTHKQDLECNLKYEFGYTTTQCQGCTSGVVQSSCIQNGVQYQNGNIPSNKFPDSALKLKKNYDSWQNCQKLCILMIGCSHFTYSGTGSVDSSGTCELFNCQTQPLNVSILEKNDTRISQNF